MPVVLPGPQQPQTPPVANAPPGYGGGTPGYGGVGGIGGVINNNTQGVLGQVAGDQGGVNAGGGFSGDFAIGANPDAPITQGQQAALFMAPGSSSINNNINTGYGLQQSANFANAPQMTSSPLAGLTTLGAVANANAPGIDTSTSTALQAGQIGQINALNQQAAGNGPSVAALQAQAQGEQNVSNAMAMMGSQRGSANSALGLRSADNSIASADQNAMYAGVLGRTQEELNAQQQLTGALGTAQGQTMQGAQAQAGLQSTANLQNAGALNQAMLTQGTMGQQTSLANAAQAEQTGLSNLTQQGTTQALNANEYNAMLQAQMTQSNNQLTAQQNYANLVTDENTQLQGIAAKVGISNAANMMGLAGAGIAGGAGIAAGALTASDRRLKTNIKSADRSMKAFLSAMGVSINNKRSGFALLESL